MKYTKQDVLRLVQEEDVEFIRLQFTDIFGTMMTLSGWFREYVYIPLGGNRVSMPRHILNLLIVWVLTGFL